MMRDDLQRLAISATTDQAAEAWGNMARLIARYHVTLRAEKMPVPLAADLTMQMAEMLICRTLWPEGAPS